MARWKRLAQQERLRRVWEGVRRSFWRIAADPRRRPIRLETASWLETVWGDLGKDFYARQRQGRRATRKSSPSYALLAGRWLVYGV